LQDNALLSDVVSQYKQRMNKEGFHVWNWSETNEEKETDGGAAGNYYYGGAALDCELDENASLTEILAESFNVEQGAGCVLQRLHLARAMSIKV
jgi:hypothetical protein